MSMLQTSSSGVGRGRGEGSRASQFKAGEPSANPMGRKKKPKGPPETFESAFAEEVSREVYVDLGDGRGRRRVPLFRAMIRQTLDNFANASASQQLKILDICKVVVTEQAKIPSEEAQQAARVEFVKRLAEEYYKDQEERRNRGEPYDQEALKRRDEENGLDPDQLHGGMGIEER